MSDQKTNHLLSSLTRARAQVFLRDTELGGEFDPDTLMVHEDGFGFTVEVATAFQMRRRKFPVGKIVEFDSHAVMMELDF